VVGWGLTLNPHRFTVNAHQLYTWCAVDALLFPTIIGQRAHIESPCPTTHTPIRLTVDPVTGVADLQPATAAVSIPGPDELDPIRVRTTFCNPGRLFASTAAARGWLTQHPTGRVLPVAAGFAHARPIATRILESANPSGPGADRG
jgi:alkylmercury lyase